MRLLRVVIFVAALTLGLATKAHADYTGDQAPNAGSQDQNTLVQPKKEALPVTGSDYTTLTLLGIGAIAVGTAIVVKTKK